MPLDWLQRRSDHPYPHHCRKTRLPQITGLRLY
ncbi:hypothetical protein EKN09_16025 [Vibrio penaeicida]|nr:hypothetical protein EKN09_16025 [Vibrio penaeicida]